MSQHESSTTDETFGALVRTHRDALGLTQQALARACQLSRRHHRRRPQSGQPAAEASDCNDRGSAAVSRSSWIPAHESWRSTLMPTPVREARDDLPRAHAVWRRPSGCCGSSAAGALSPRDNLFSVLPWNAWERASHRRRARKQKPRRVRQRLSGSR